MRTILEELLPNQSSIRGKCMKGTSSLEEEAVDETCRGWWSQTWLWVNPDPKYSDWFLHLVRQSWAILAVPALSTGAAFCSQALLLLHVWSGDRRYRQQVLSSVAMGGWEWVSTRSERLETLSLFVLLLVLWEATRESRGPGPGSCCACGKAKQNVSVSRRALVAEPGRWGRWHRWASAGKGDVASVRAQRARLPSWATNCFPLLCPMGHPAEPCSTPQPAASACAVLGIVRNADVRWRKSSSC